MINNWRTIAAALAVLSLSYILHRLDVYRLEDRHRAALAQQADSIQNECKAAQLVTQEVSRDYQNAIVDLNGQLASAKRLRPNACIAVHKPNPPCRCDGSTTSTEFSGSDVGVARFDLLDFSRDAEQVRLQLKACQKFVARTNTPNPIN